ncbi:MAG: sigma 54-interacting transcriptional regulator [Bacteroidota bacterium]
MKTQPTQTILFLWHDTSKGIGFLKNFLAACYKKYINLRTPSIRKAKHRQNDLDKGLDDPSGKFPFDEIYIFHVSDEIYARHSTPKDRMRADHWKQDVEAGICSEKIDLNWTRIYEKGLTLKSELAYIKSHFPDDEEEMKAQLWRRINHYPLSDQQYWLECISNYAPFKFRNGQKKRIHWIQVDALKPVKDIRNMAQLLEGLRMWRDKVWSKIEDAKCFVLLNMGNKEAHTLWYLLNERYLLPKDSHFIQGIILKNSLTTKDRYKNIQYNIVDKDLFQKTKIPDLYQSSSSPERNRIPKMLKIFKELGFSILITGPRGIGKTHLLESTFSTPDQMIRIHCGVLNDPHFFEGQFLGKQGQLRAAHQKILFLDDLHLLTQEVQHKVFHYLSTDDQNRLVYFDEQTSIKIISATHLPISELKKTLVPPFYDRMVQYNVRIPALKETFEDRESDWRATWKGLAFPEPTPFPADLLRWLKQLSLPGNFRDLQRIAMAYRAWSEFPSHLRKDFPKGTTACSYAKESYDEQIDGDRHTTASYIFHEHQTLAEIQNEFKQALATWANHTFGSDQKASDHFKELDISEKITRVTLNNWRLGKTNRP